MGDFFVGGLVRETILLARANRCDHEWVSYSGTEEQCTRCAVIATEEGKKELAAMAVRREEAERELKKLRAHVAEAFQVAGGATGPDCCISEAYGDVIRDRDDLRAKLGETEAKLATSRGFVEELGRVHSLLQDLVDDVIGPVETSPCEALVGYLQEHIADLAQSEQDPDEKPDWHQVGDGAFARPFGTIRVCIECGCLVAGGPTRCVRCAESNSKTSLRETLAASEQARAEQVAKVARYAPVVEAAIRWFNHDHDSREPLTVHLISAITDYFIACRNDGSDRVPTPSAIRADGSGAMEGEAS